MYAAARASPSALVVPLSLSLDPRGYDEFNQAPAQQCPLLDNVSRRVSSPDVLVLARCIREVWWVSRAFSLSNAYMM